MNNVCHAGFRNPLRAHTSFYLRVRQYSVHRGLTAGAIQLKIAHHHDAFALDLQEDKGIRSHEPGRIVEIRIRFTRGDHEGRAIIYHRNLPQ